MYRRYGRFVVTMMLCAGLVLGGCGQSVADDKTEEVPSKQNGETVDS